MKLFSRVFQHAGLLWDAMATGFLNDEKDAFGRKPAKRDVSSSYRFIIQREGLAYFHVEYDLAPAPLHSSPVPFSPCSCQRKDFLKGLGVTRSPTDPFCMTHQRQAMDGK